MSTELGSGTAAVTVNVSGWNTKLLNAASPIPKDWPAAVKNVLLDPAAADRVCIPKLVGVYEPLASSNGPRFEAASFEGSAD